MLVTTLPLSTAKQGFYKAFPPPGIEVVSRSGWRTTRRHSSERP